MNNRKMKAAAVNIRKRVVALHNRAGTSHIGSALSCVDLLTGLYFSALRLAHNKLDDPARDRFILSKGHAVSGLYATLREKGIIDDAVLREYCCDGKFMPGHATLGSVPGIEVSTGSLGHGLSIGSGMAFAEKNDRSGYRVFVLLSDGECDEGSTWEAALFAAHHHLDNLVVVIDYNKMQALGRKQDVMNIEPLSDKWRSFGWETKEIDGHDMDSIVEALSHVPLCKGKPTVIVAHTIKGKGVSFMEDKLAWHYKSPSKDESERALKELDDEKNIR